MTDLPESFRAYVVDKAADGAFSRGLRDLTPADLPPGELTIRVEWSSVNFKDGLAARADALRRKASAETAAGIDAAVERLAGGGAGMGELFKVLAVADPRLGPLAGFDTGPAPA